MAKLSNPRQRMKGSSTWSLSYALSSLTKYPSRNMGIALVLAIGIALPTTVFVWSNTGTTLVVSDYFEERTYQMSLRLKPNALYDRRLLDDIIETAEDHPLTDTVHRIVSTAGVLANDTFPDWEYYDAYGSYQYNYVEGVKDGRVVLTTNEILGNWSREFDYTGKFTLNPGELLVSEGFISYTQDVLDIELEIGDEVDIDIIAHEQRAGQLRSREELSVEPAHNLTIVGIYSIKNLNSQIGNAFVSIMRKNWDPLGFAESVLGIEDSVIMLSSEIGEEKTEEIANWGYFKSAILVRASESELIARGSQNFADNLITFKSQFEEEFPTYQVSGLLDIWELDSQIQTYLDSQILTIVAFPVLIMSLMLTVFTSEAAVSRRKGEISALRAKGASYNQIFSTFMWESLFLALAGLLIGLGLSLVMGPLIGSSTGLFVFNMGVFLDYITHLTMPSLGLIIAAVIALYLPATYLLHVARRIDVSEVGQPMDNQPDEVADTGNGWRYGIGLGLTLSALLLMPTLASPRGMVAILETLIATLLLFVASYFGSRAMRHFTARVSGGTNFLLGEKSLYLSQSLRKRKGQFIPLLVILTLTLTTTTMMLVQTSSFQATVDNELAYAIGADMRVECDPKPFDFNKTLKSYPGVIDATPVIQTWGQVSTSRFFLEGIDPLRYLDIGRFSAGSFVGNSSESILTELDQTNNGIVISEYYADLWNKTTGDGVLVYYGGIEDTLLSSFKIVGIMKSAPAFGIASTDEINGPSFAAQFGFQAGQGGFALVNLDFLSERSGIDRAELFLVDTICFADVTPIIESLSEEKNTHVFTVETFDISTQSYSLQLFLSGIQGLTVISFALCAAMGLSAIALFLGSSVSERSQEYALFRAIGSTEKQVVSMVFGEFAGSVVAAISISVFLGFFFGYAMSLLTFGVSPFSPVLAEVLSFPIAMLIVIISLESLVMLASCYIPAKRAGRVDPAEALRNL